VTVIGWTAASSAEATSIRSLSLADVRRSGPVEAAREALQAIPASAPILLHFDIDVLRESDMPAAYFPHVEGLSLSEATELLAAVLEDPRIRIIEVAEYAALRDLDRRCVSRLVDVLTVALT
jgi:arginase